MPYTLLLADASTTIQRIVELTFASEDIAVVAFSDGDHAIASLDRSVPDIVLADVGLPGRSGYDLSRYIKNSPPLAHIPVLLLTGAFEPVDQPKALESNCDGILIKPFEPQFVISRVKELLRKPQPGSKEDEVEQYFEELDKAFANLATSPPPAVEAQVGAIEPPLDRPIKLSVASPIKPSAAPAIELSAAPPIEPSVSAPIEPIEGFVRAPIEAPVSAPSESSASQPAVSPSAASPTARPSLADAFVALLAAERSANGDNRPIPTLASSSRAVSSDEVIERVTRRVLEQLSDTVVRETVTDIVQTTAERLVREEIERIKSNIK